MDLATTCDELRTSLLRTAWVSSITMALFRKDGYDFTTRNDIKAEEILYNTDVITSIAKSIVHSPAESPFRSDNILL